VVSGNRTFGDPFELRKDAHKKEWTARLVDDLVTDLDLTGKPRFRWVHLLDTHAPFLRGGAADAAIDRYREEVRHVDTELSRFFGALDASPRGRSAVVVLLADHGESFGEHGGSFHGANMFDETVRIPMLMRLPGIGPRSITGPATTLDVLPTIASYLGWQAADSWQGHNWLQPGDAPPMRVLSQVESLDAWSGAGLPAMQLVHDGRHKLIVNIEENISSLYDLVADPGESRDLVAELPELAQSLQRTWADWEDWPGCRDESPL
jgi:arylsulfatase A-like enzyme